jgi:hypothetical protein
MSFVAEIAVVKNDMGVSSKALMEILFQNSCAFSASCSSFIKYPAIASFFEKADEEEEYEEDDEEELEEDDEEELLLLLPLLKNSNAPNDALGPINMFPKRAKRKINLKKLLII